MFHYYNILISEIKFFILSKSDIVPVKSPQGVTTRLRAKHLREAKALFTLGVITTLEINPFVVVQQFMILL